jgi:hypothetical protein
MYAHISRSEGLAKTICRGLLKEEEVEAYKRWYFVRYIPVP